MQDQNFGLSGKDICAIIKQCDKSGVAEFRLGDLFIKFGNQAKQDEGFPLEAIQPSGNQAGQLDLFKEDDKTPEEMSIYDLDYIAAVDPVRWEKIQTGEERLVNEEVQ